MPKVVYVVFDPNTKLCLTSYNIGTPQLSLFGALENAITFSSQADADAISASIGGGTVGTRKPPPTT